MKIVKAEKSLWTFLNVFKSIISKSDSQTIIIGNGGTLIINTLNFYGVFKYKNDGMIDVYNFGQETFYELKQLPSSDYVLDKRDNPITDEQQEQILKRVVSLLQNSKWELELDKSDPTKIAKIVASTGLWMDDADVKYLNVFYQTDVFSDEQSKALLFKSSGLTKNDISVVEMYLIFAGLGYEAQIQDKMDMRELEVKEEPKEEKYEDEMLSDAIDELEEDFEAVEEFDNDFDPMSI